MIWGLVYLFSLLAVLAYVLRTGERETSFAILTVVTASLLTLVGLIISDSRFDIFSLLVTVLDFGMLVVFLGHALVSRRYWTLCLPAFQLLTCMTHVMKYVLPDLWPRLYSAGQGFWAYPQILVILLATMWVRAAAKAQREADKSADRPEP
ncbi:hypothetical protein FHR22_000368 [Sphingopyxis panaciterrae]|uniref:hypothetical protein n=1 Tax=Sphingopyxis panaciterrae TaxID=363841 RepID=UPI001420535C|nr:hypothetical protein [Sphingopyxis panaciterrae]NIJ35719.1 hypothetical protein [Sphingopyxis panaciterrae]